MNVGLIAFVLFFNAISPLKLLAETDPESWPDYAYAAQDPYLHSGVGAAFGFIEGFFVPLAFILCGAACIVTWVIGKHRHSVGFGLVTIVALCARYLISIATTGGLYIFLFICLGLVAVLKLLWQDNSSEQDPLQKREANNILSAGKVTARELADSPSYQQLPTSGALTGGANKYGLASGGFSKGFTGIKQ